MSHSLKIGARALLLALAAAPALAPADGAAWASQLQLGPRRALLANAAHYVGVGDLTPGASFYIGLRAYSAAIAKAGVQKLVNLRNGTTSESCDAIVAAGGGLGAIANCTGASNGKTVAAFCFGATCTATKGYDQTGNGRDVAQSVAANQPTLSLDCGNRLPCLQSASSSIQLLSSANFTPVTGVMTLNVVFSRIGVQASGSPAYVGATTNDFISSTISPNVARLTVQSVGNVVATAADAAWHSAIGALNGVSSSMLVDGALSTGSLTGSASAGKIQFIAGAAGVTAEAAEAGFWDNAILTAATQKAVCHNQKTYWGFAGSC